MKTLKLRIKDKHATVLTAMAVEVNTVWNFCNETSHKAIRDKRKFLSSYDLDKLTAGYSKVEGVKIGSVTIQEVSAEYATRRKQFKKSKLRWRVSNPKSAKRSLGWVPFKVGALKYKAGQIQFAGMKFSLWDSYGLGQFKLRSGSFNQDARGRWYVNICVEEPQFVGPRQGQGAVGIDLGCKTAATCSDGQTLEGRTFRAYEKKLASAQRARQKGQARTIHAKIANVRKDALHKLSTAIVRNNAMVFVGDVSSKALVKTKMSKSVHDAGWSMFKTMLEYKSHQAGIVYEEVNESYTTQTCSSCGLIPTSSPKGRAGLGIRGWTCSSCGVIHDRDVNAARNILAVGLGRLVEGIPALKGGVVINMTSLEMVDYIKAPCAPTMPTRGWQPMPLKLNKGLV
jgi:IS605 OrfB family transposase